MKKKPQKPTLKERFVFRWVQRGFSDWALSFLLNDLDDFSSQRTFLMIQALEKFGKGLLIQYEVRELGQINSETDIARIHKVLTRNFGHRIRKIIYRLEAETPIKVTEKVRHQKFFIKHKKSVSGLKILKLLSGEAFPESRYPVQNPIYKRFPIDDSLYYDLLESDGPESVSTVILKVFFEALYAADPKMAKYLFSKMPVSFTRKQQQRFCNLYLQFPRP